jgi:hypothetical protein
MSKTVRTGYDYIPSPGEDYHPQGKPSENRTEGRIVAHGTDSNLVEQADGSLVVTDKKGSRREW